MFHFHPLTPDRWQDLETLFGPRGAMGGCWCMWWRLKRSEFERNKGEGNRLALKAIVDTGHVPGILAYQGEQPVGWCSVAPRQEFSAFERSRILKPVDDQEVWSIVCFFVARPYRRLGLSTQLIQAAIEYAGQSGARIVEAYPTGLQPGKGSPDPFVFTGLLPAFTKTGFKEIARRSETRPIMRYVIKD